MMATEIQPHVEYYAGRTDSWRWVDGQEHWWEKWLVWLNGWDGLGQYVCEIRWRWNGSRETLRREYVHLGEQALRELIGGEPAALSSPGGAAGE